MERNLYDIVSGLINDLKLDCTIEVTGEKVSIVYQDKDFNAKLKKALSEQSIYHLYRKADTTGETTDVYKFVDRDKALDNLFKAYPTKEDIIGKSIRDEEKPYGTIIGWFRDYQHIPKTFGNDITMKALEMYGIIQK